MNASPSVTIDAFPACYASATSRGLSASIFTKNGSFNVLDATAPGMTPEKSLARAQFMVKASSLYPALVAAMAETETLAQELMQRATEIDRKLADTLGATLDCELGQITRLRGQLSKNRALIS